MLEALRVRDFRLLWSARLTSNLGSWLMVVAVPAYVFQISGSLVAVGLSMVAQYLPSLFLSPIAGVIADRWKRKQIMVSMDLFRTVALILLFFVHSHGTVWLLYSSMAMESVGAVFFRPASQSLTPLVVGRGTALSSAASLNAFTDAVVRLAGAPLGAALMVLSSFDLLVVLDMASYLASALFIARVHGRYAWPERAEASARGALAQMAAGLTSVRRSPVALALLPVSVLFLTANASLSALLVPFGVTYWGGERQVGLIVSALGVGFMAGAPLMRRLLDRVQPRSLLAGALVIVALGYFGLFHSHAVLPALGAAVVIGAAGSQALAVPQVVLQRVIPSDFLGRVSAAFFTGEALATLVGSLSGPALAQTSGYRLALDVACAVTALTAVLDYFLVPVTNMADGSEPHVEESAEADAVSSPHT